MSRPGKIARLPHEVRTELNRRMNNNEPGETLLGWLNGQAAVRAVLNEQFEGAEISNKISATGGRGFPPPGRPGRSCWPRRANWRPTPGN